MMVHGCIEIHPKECRGWIIVMDFRGFINFTTSILRNFTGGGIKCPYRKCKNKKYLHSDVVMMHLLHKGFMKDYLCWYAHEKLFVRNESKVERVVGSNSRASNVHELVNDNSNPYKKNMVMDAMRMNQGNVVNVQS
jgi:hypothetical protein